MSVYKIFLTERGTEIWNLKLDNIELLAGALAVGMGIVYDLNYDIATSDPVGDCPRLYGQCPDICVPDSDSCDLLGSNKQYILDSNGDVSSFRIVSEIPENKVLSNMRIVSDEGYYGLWIRGTNRGFYSLYSFRTSYFLQGLVSLCNCFQTDFRTYIYGLPFDKLGARYVLSGHIMTYPQIAEDTVDLFDNEEEEMDEYDTPVPFSRTDD